MAAGFAHYTGTIVGALWLGFVLFWLVAAAFAKRSAGGSAKLAVFRLLLAIGVALLARMLLHSHLLRDQAAHAPAAFGIAGAAICAAGIAVAIWARLYLGRNWGMPMSLRREHELVTSGPYALVRHPIYFGILLAMLGTAVALGYWWLLLCAVFFCYFAYAATVEERAMKERFPDQYPEYMRRTKMLIPCIF